MARRRHRKIPAFQATPAWPELARRAPASASPRRRRAGTRAAPSMSRRVELRAAGSRTRSPGGHLRCPSVTSGRSMSNAPVARSLAGGPQHLAEDLVPLGSIWRRPGPRHDLVVGPVDRDAWRGRWPPPCCGPIGSMSRPASGSCSLDQPLVAPVGHDRDVVGRQPRRGRLEERPLTEQRQEGLWALGTAERVESGPAAAGHDDGVHARPS